MYLYLSKSGNKSDNMKMYGDEETKLIYNDNYIYIYIYIYI